MVFPVSSGLNTSNEFMIRIRRFKRYWLSAKHWLVSAYFFRIPRRATFLLEATCRGRFAFPRKARRVSVASMLCFRLVEAFFWALLTRVLLLRTNFFPSTCAACDR
jgi:hypothetical protein